MHSSFNNKSSRQCSNQNKEYTIGRTEKTKSHTYVWTKWPKSFLSILVRDYRSQVFLLLYVRKNLYCFKFSNLKISIKFREFNSIFACEFNLFIAPWGLRHLHDGFPGGGAAYSSRTILSFHLRVKMAIMRMNIT